MNSDCRTTLTVSELNEAVRSLVESNLRFRDLCVVGEISNYKIYPSGHHYFTLKDSESSLRCVMFRASASRLRFRPENGMRVFASGSLRIYPRDGAYQLYCNGIVPDGVGDLQIAFEQLKQNIEFFDEKKPLNDDDIATLLTAAHFETTGKNAGTVPCTACRYCTTHCPQGLDIPRILSLYNEHSYSGGGFIAPMALASFEQDKLPSACVGCGSCAKVCPQQIDIPGVMKKFTEMIG